MRSRSATPISTILLTAASALATNCSTYVSFAVSPGPTIGIVGLSITP